MSNTYIDPGSRLHPESPNGHDEVSFHNHPPRIQMRIEVLT